MKSTDQEPAEQGAAMRTGVRLGQLFGVEILLDWSLMIIFVLITFGLAAGVFPAWHPDWNPLLIWITALAAALLFFASILAHEMSHALVGRANGIEVRQIRLFMFGGMAQMEDEPPTWKSEFAMAIVGPITSLVLGFLFLWLAGVISGPIALDADNPQQTLASLGPLTTLLLWLGPVNILLALFNLVPGFPLDGGRVLRAFLWGITGDHIKATRWASLGGRAFGWLLILTGFAMILGIPVPIFGVGLVNGLWLIFIGWFLHAAAAQSYKQLLLRKSLHAVPVSRLMQTQYHSVAPEISLNTLAEDYVMASGQRVFPVEENGRLLGLVTLRDLGKRERSEWPVSQVREVMTPMSSLVTLSPGQDAFDGLALMGQRNLNQLPVVAEGRLLGLVHREDVLKWLFLHGEGKLPPRQWEGR